MNNMEEKKQTYFEVDVRQIKPLNRAGGNIRVDYGDIDELVASIKHNGIIMPIKGYRDKENEGQWITIEGHRRIFASMILVEQGHNIMAKIIMVDSKKISDEQLIYEMVIANSGKALTPLEMSEAVRRLIAYGHSVKDIATGFGKNTYFVKNLELLSLAPKRVREMIQQNKISYSLVLEILKKSKDFNEAIETIEKSLSVVRQEKKSKDFEFEVSELDEDIEIKITKKHLDKAQNKIDSLRELQRFFKRQIDMDRPINALNSSIYTFAKKIVENQLTIAEIEKLLLQQ